MDQKPYSRFLPHVFLAFALSVPSVSADTLIPATVSENIDHIATTVLHDTGVPSASIAIVKERQVAYVKAYGNARLNPAVAATPAMRYSIGSISKQFSATAILLLVQENKLSLDDKVSRFFPGLTRADDITIRELLSHTSGYSDYWPQDYLMPSMKLPTTPQYIVDTWGKQPLGFEPGTQWQYSNTGFVMIGAIIQQITGLTPFAFLQRHVFGPLHMDSPYNINVHALPATDAEGYQRYALGPLHPAPKEGANWLFGAGELAMTASDLAKWDISILAQSILQPASYRELETEVRLRNGVGSGYGLGVSVDLVGGRRVLQHEGEVSGFTAINMVFPDDDTAVVVLTNQDAAYAANIIAERITGALFQAHDPATNTALAQARKIFSGLQHGQIDRSLFTANANDYFNAAARRDYQSSLAPLGNPTSFVQRSWYRRGGMVMREYGLVFPHDKLTIKTYATPDGKLEQYIVSTSS